MYRIKIPVSAFVKKVILSLHDGNEPVKLKACDTLTGQLTCVKPGDSAKVDKVVASLNTEVEFMLTPLVAKQINKRRWRVGLQLDNYYREKLNDYVAAKVESGITATSAIQQWCLRNGVDIDVDISFAALYRDWQRFDKAQKITKKNPTFFSRQRSTSVHRVDEKTTQVLKAERLFSDNELDDIISQYHVQNASLFHTTRGANRKKLFFQLQLFVYRTIGKRSPKYICQKFHLNRQYRYDRTTQSGKNYRIEYDSKLRYAVRSFKIFLKTAPPIVLPIYTNS